VRAQLGIQDTVKCMEQNTVVDTVLSRQLRPPAHRRSRDQVAVPVTEQRRGMGEPALLHQLPAADT
jgi:hypothetical protein